MNGEVVDAAKDGQASPRVGLRPRHDNPRRGVALTGPRAKDGVRVCEEERQELLGPCRQPDNQRDVVDPPRIMPYAQTYGLNTALAGAIFV